MAAKDRHEIFAREYVIDLNGTRAAIASGYKADNAEVTASQLLSNPKVRKRVDELLSHRASKLEIKADRVIEEIRRLAMSNMQDYTRVDEDGKPILDFSKLDRDKFAAVQEIREDATGGVGDGERKVVLRTTLKLADKTKNLDMLMRHLGLYNDKLAITGLEGLASNLSELRKLKNAVASS